MKFSSSLVFQFLHFGQTATMTLRATESRGEKCLDQFPSEGVTDYEAPKADHVQIVILDALVRRKGFMNQAGPNSLHFVRDDRCANTASTDGDAALYLSSSYGAGQRYDKIRIIVVHLRLTVAEIDHFMTGLAQHLEQMFF
jgi:hypothetical protein